MSDQCRTCTVRGDMVQCLATSCGHHEDWFALELRTRLDMTQRTMDELSKRTTQMKLDIMGICEAVDPHESRTDILLSAVNKIYAKLFS